MKKLRILFISFILTGMLAACGDNQQQQNSTSAPASESVSETFSNTERSETTASSFESISEQKEETSVNTKDLPETNILVVYYSATGNTEEIANYIAAATNAEVFELEPAQPYSRDDLDWTDKDSRVVYEHDNPDEREIELVAATIPNWETYDTVFIGYPIWWGIAAWPIDGFIKANDFTGKTVIPFCTSSSSGLGDSGELLKEMSGTGDWLNGERFSSGASEDTVQTWVESLGL